MGGPCGRLRTCSIYAKPMRFCSCTRCTEERSRDDTTHSRNLRARHIFGGVALLCGSVLEDLKDGDAFPIGKMRLILKNTKSGLLEEKDKSHGHTKDSSRSH